MAGKDKVTRDAEEFGVLVRQGGWRLGLLVARNVKPGEGQGARQPRNARNDDKVSAQEFARKSDTSAPRVLRYLTAWDKAAAVPATIEEATERLTTLDGLLTAREWERAAIVYAFTREGGQGEYKIKNRTSAVFTAGEFAKLEIVGLWSDNTVRKYRNAWQHAVDEGAAKPAEPGKVAALPKLDWPPTGNSHDDPEAESPE